MPLFEIIEASNANCALCIVLCALIKAVWLQTQYQMRDYLFVINCRLKKTQNCPKTSVFDHKTAISWSVFPEKKQKTVPSVSAILYLTSEI